MNCEKYQALVSDYLDGALTKEECARLNAHFAKCPPCMNVRRELEVIIGFCRDHRGEYIAPPNPQAMWLRIRNTVEAEFDQHALRTAAEERGASHVNWWTRAMNRSWELSLPQLTAAVVVIVAFVALATIFSVQQLGGGGAPQSAEVNFQRNITNGVTTDPGMMIDGRTRQQQLAIEYWNQRVAERKARWNPQMREAFDRNMSVIDQAVNESRESLMKNPHDEISEEMLNDALNNKMELLKEFSDL